MCGTINMLKTKNRVESSYKQIWVKPFQGARGWMLQYQYCLCCRLFCSCIINVYISCRWFDSAQSMKWRVTSSLCNDYVSWHLFCLRATFAHMEIKQIRKSSYYLAHTRKKTPNFSGLQELRRTDFYLTEILFWGVSSNLSTGHRCFSKAFNLG